VILGQCDSQTIQQIRLEIRCLDELVTGDVSKGLIEQEATEITKGSIYASDQRLFDGGAEGCGSSQTDFTNRVAELPEIGRHLPAIDDQL
jgi:hypothetical protein